MPAVCDNMSVGVIVHDSDGRIALLQRARFPVGIAPAAGHIDDHGTPKKAGVEELREELDLKVEAKRLKKTVIQAKRMNNRCRRAGGDHHIWWVYETYAARGTITADPDETLGAGWFDRVQLQELADRTAQYQAGEIDEDDWFESPGLEEVWVEFFKILGYIS